MTDTLNACLQLREFSFGLLAGGASFVSIFSDSGNFLKL